MLRQVSRALVFVFVVAVLHFEVSTAAAVDQQACSWLEAETVTGAETGHDSSQVHSQAVVSGMSALVLGGTGAVGHQIVQQLLASDQWSTVITLGRREVPLAADAAGSSKLQQVVLNLDNLQSDPQAAAAFTGVDAVFCALGTTRATAGSAEVFKKVDFEYVAAAAAVAKGAGVPYFGLVSAQGANANVPASDFRLLHPLLYTQTKGKAEEAVKLAGFARAAIFRPGLLDRGDKARLWEKIASPLLFGVPVANVAKAMILDAEAFRVGKAYGGSTATFADYALRKSAASGEAPQL